MSKIPLRAYNREIEEALEQKLVEEAIAHCLHVLKIFPKHIETYKLLGKAYLESQRYGNAADIFQRVLSSVPDDFISHIGMSIIREDESVLDAAIWHMERAFESQPYNTAIQGELRRLYGQRDGMEPPKIRMTRGALARMYAKSDLYDQAISEIRSNLAEDPQRSDLQVLLARMYVKSGKQTEAIEVCSSLLQRLPFCIEANRYLSDIFSDGERSEEMRTYRQRIESLDPYEAHTSPQAPSADDVPDQAVSLPRLDWDGGPVITNIPDQPEWATSIGVDLDQIDPDDQDLPDWLNSSSAIPLVGDDLGDAEDETIPSWMEDAGLGQSNGESDESKSSSVFDEEAQVTQDAVSGSIPEWLQEIAPDPSDESQDLEASTESTSKKLPEWLSEEADGATDTIINWLDDKEKEGTEEVIQESSDTSGDIDSEAIASDQDIPDWIQELGPRKPEGETEEIPDWLVDMVDDPSTPTIESITEGADKTASIDTPDWLQDIGVDVPETTKAIQDDISDNLQEIEDGSAGSEPIAPISSESLEDPETTETTEWLQVLEQDTQIPESKISESESLEHLEDAVPAEIPDWLQDMEVASPNADQEETIPTEDLEKVESFEIPDWLQNLEEDTPETGDVEPIAQVDDVKSEDLEDVEKEEIIEFLQGLEESTPEIETFETIALGDQDENLDQGVAETTEIPDWLQELEDDTPDPASEMAFTLEEQEDSETIEIPNLLEVLAEDTPESETTLEGTITLPHKDDEEPTGIPEWLQKLEPDTSNSEQAATESLKDQGVAESVEISDIFQGMPEDAAETEQDESISLEDLV